MLTINYIFSLAFLSIALATSGFILETFSVSTIATVLVCLLGLGFAVELVFFLLTPNRSSTDASPIMASLTLISPCTKLLCFTFWVLLFLTIGCIKFCVRYAVDNRKAALEAVQTKLMAYKARLEGFRESPTKL